MHLTITDSIEKDLKLFDFIKNLKKYQLDTEVSYFNQKIVEDDQQEKYDFKNKPFSKLKRPQFKIQNQVRKETSNQTIDLEKDLGQQLLQDQFFMVQNQKIFDDKSNDYYQNVGVKKKHDVSQLKLQPEFENANHIMVPLTFFLKMKSKGLNIDYRNH